MMKNEKLYSMFGQALYAALLVLLCASVFWVWRLVAQFLGGFLPSSLAAVSAVVALLVMVLIARKSIGLAIWLFLTLAGVERIFLAAAPGPWDTLIGILCLLFSGVVLIGVLSEHFRWAREKLPSVLLIVLGFVFFAPVALIGRILQLVGIAVTSAGNKSDEH